MPRRSRGSILFSLDLVRSRARPLGEQLYLQIRELALSGHLQAGDRLPSTRRLATEYGVARSTAADAYDRLAAEGIITSRVGSGAYVAGFIGAPIVDQDRQRRSAVRSSAGAARRLRLSRAVEYALPRLAPRVDHPSRCFATAMPDFDLFPTALWSRYVARAAASGVAGQLGYPDARGLPEFRRAVAAHLKINRGISCEPDQVFVFAGAQHAIHFINSMVLEPGDKVWFENPGPIGVRNSLITCGARVVPVPVDADGLIVAEGLKAAPDFRLAFVTPTHQHPLAVAMNLERRLQLLAAAESANAIIIEDDYDGDFQYGRHPVQALQNIDRSGRVIYVGSFSKSLYPSLRLGFAVVPGALVDAFEKAVSAFLHGAPAQSQAAVAAFIESGHFALHLRSMRRVYQARSQALLAAAGRHLAGLLSVWPTDAGLHTVGQLEFTGDQEALGAKAAAEGITATPLSRFCVVPTTHRGFLLGFSVRGEEDIERAARQLGRVLEAAVRRRFG